MRFSRLPVGFLYARKTWIKDKCRSSTRKLHALGWLAWSGSRLTSCTKLVHGSDPGPALAWSMVMLSFCMAWKFGTYTMLFFYFKISFLCHRI